MIFLDLKELSHDNYVLLYLCNEYKIHNLLTKNAHRTENTSPVVSEFLLEARSLPSLIFNPHKHPLLWVSDEEIFVLQRGWGHGTMGNILSTKA